jgi:anti-sigma regulatory factor (Ser/Thr protein kinase)
MENLLSTQGRQARFHIGEPSEIATARRAACDLARTLGFNETITGEVAIVVTEAGTNIHKYAGSGEILLRRALRHDGAVGIEILALDQGPGIPHLAHCMQDGHTTGASYGIGLGTMARLADQFDIYSATGQGTVICLSFWCKPDAGMASGCDIGIVCLAAAGATPGSDAWHVRREGSEATALPVDGPAQGLLPAMASDPAFLALVHGPLTIMHTDSVRADWDLGQYPGLAPMYTALIAAVLYRDFNRGNDKATVLVARQNKGSKS